MAGNANIIVTIKNGRGFRALQKANLIAAELKESQPWNDDVKLLVKALRIVNSELRTLPVKP